MAMPFGVSFLPGGDASYTRGGGQPSGATPIQQAIQILSMRVPRIVGQNPLAPLSLLTGQGGQGLPPGVLERLLRQQIPEPNPPTLPPVSQVPPPQTGAPSAPYVPYVPTPQLQPPQMAKPPMAPPQMAPPKMGPSGPSVTGAPSPANSAPPQGTTTSPDLKDWLDKMTPKIDFQPGPYNPEPGLPPPPPNQWADVQMNPGNQPSGIEAASQWAQAQLKRRRMGTY